jgi:hypothetical protein
MGAPPSRQVMQITALAAQDTFVGCWLQRFVRHRLAIEAQLAPAASTTFMNRQSSPWIYRKAPVPGLYVDKDPGHVVAALRTRRDSDEGDLVDEKRVQGFALPLGSQDGILRTMERTAVKRRWSGVYRVCGGIRGCEFKSARSGRCR